MKRLLALALLGLLAGQADAQLIKLGGPSGGGKKKGGSGNEPPPLGPWYNYWPLEAHFQVPAMPEYPYFSAPQTLPVVPNGGNGGPPPVPNGGQGMRPYGAPNGYQGYPGQMPNSNGAPPQVPNARNYPGAANPYGQISGYPGYGYPNYGYGYQQFPQRPLVAPNPGNVQRP